MNIWAILKNLKKNCLAQKSFIVSWTTEKLVTNNMNTFLKIKKKLILAKVVRCPRLGLWVGYFIYFELTRISSIVNQSLRL